MHRADLRALCRLGLTAASSVLLLASCAYVESGPDLSESYRRAAEEGAKHIRATLDVCAEDQLVGSVTNTGPETVFFVSVTVRFLDRRGREVDGTGVFYRNLDSGQSFVWLRTWGLPDSFESCSVRTAVDGVEVSVQAEQASVDSSPGVVGLRRDQMLTFALRTGPASHADLNGFEWQIREPGVLRLVSQVRDGGRDPAWDFRYTTFEFQPVSSGTAESVLDYAPIAGGSQSLGEVWSATFAVD